jgi:hypothetical protein
VLLRLLAVATVLGLTGCGSSAKETATTTGSDLPPGCTVPEIDAIVTSFLATPVLAPTGSFQVYAAYDGDGRRFVARSRTKALAHLRARRALGEVDRLIQLRVSAQDVNHARITFRLTRYAPDFRGRGIHGRLAQGGGTIDCAHGRVAAWVMRGP